MSEAAIATSPARGQSRKEVLNQALITRYAKLNALKRLIEDWLESKRDAIRDALIGGEDCPARGPYLLYLCQAESRIDWKAEFAARLREMEWPQEQIDALFKSI